MRVPARYGILVGLLMIGQWTFTILAGAVPEFQTAPWEIAFHLIAEFTTALLLLTGGIATLRSTTWGSQILLAGLGMVIYSEIASPGYYVQLGQWGFVAMFGVLLFGAVWSVMALLRQTNSSWIKAEFNYVEKTG
jgi:hypothetical protein